jgi:hypothetical protein
VHLLPRLTRPEARGTKKSVMEVGGFKMATECFGSCASTSVQRQRVPDGGCVVGA